MFASFHILSKKISSSCNFHNYLYVHFHTLSFYLCTTVRLFPGWLSSNIKVVPLQFGVTDLNPAMREHWDTLYPFIYQEKKVETSEAVKNTIDHEHT